MKAAAIESSGNRFAEVNPSFREMIPEHSESGCSPVSICLGDAVIHVNEAASGSLLHRVIEAVYMSIENSVNRSLKTRSLLTKFGTCSIAATGAVTI